MPKRPPSAAAFGFPFFIFRELGIFEKDQNNKRSALQLLGNCITSEEQSYAGNAFMACREYPRRMGVTSHERLEKRKCAFMFTTQRLFTVGYSITGDHSKQDQILLVKIGKYIGFCLYRRSYLLWSPVIEATLDGKSTSSGIAEPFFAR